MVATSVYAAGNLGTLGIYTMAHNTHPCPAIHSTIEAKTEMREITVPETDGTKQNDNDNPRENDKEPAERSDTARYQEEHSHTENVHKTRGQANDIMSVQTIQPLSKDSTSGRKAPPCDQFDHFHGCKTALPTYTQCQQLELHSSRIPTKMTHEHDQPELMAEMMKVIAIAVAAPVVLLTILAATAAICIYYRHFYKNENVIGGVVTKATQDDGIIVLPGGSQDNSAVSCSLDKPPGMISPPPSEAEPSPAPWTERSARWRPGLGSWGQMPRPVLQARSCPWQSSMVTRQSLEKVR